MENNRNKIPQKLDYGVAVTMKVLGGKYKPCIIVCIADGIKRPYLIHKKMKTVNLRVLSQQLRELYEYEVLSKTVFNERPLKVEYELTELGRSLLPIISAMEVWGNQNAEKIYSIALKRNENVVPL